ncbi:MAG: tetratricopeptide repeat protein [Candidatus Cloacimonadaceae bacterium]|jgi:tetratricopeptide (TPR) repeat protein|nr:tetratricopeptide repeat protein [Candidatus Cloacimonadota bacterium]MCK9242897.1 tetratricopeptide repeat protein [Candidatus Cloacimonadota bacterium]MDY0126772.1 tetratricopeptide repeat protein [Candidatus Cloacimonadaceae bacterium]
MDIEQTLEKAKALSKTNWVHAIHLLTSAEEKHPEDIRLHTLMADLHFFRLQYKHAIKHYLKALSADPGNTRIIQAVASCYMANNEYRLALAYFKRIPNPTDDVLYNTGYLYAILGRHKDCISIMKELLTRLPGHPFVYYVLIEQYYELGLYDEALKYTKIALQKAGEQQQLYLLAALVYSVKEQWLPAYYSYRQAQSMGAINNIDHYLRYANAASVIGFPERAINILLQAEGKWPYVSDIYTMLLRLLIKRKDYTQAKRVVVRARKNLRQLPSTILLLIERMKTDSDKP